MSPRRLLCLRAHQFAAATFRCPKETMMYLHRMVAAAHKLSAEKLRETGERGTSDAALVLEQLAEELES